MLYLDRKINEVINVESNQTKASMDVVVLGVRRRFNRSTREYDYIVKLGFVDDAKEYTFLRKEVKMRQDGTPNPNPYFKDNIPFTAKELYDVNKILQEEYDPHANDEDRTPL